MKQFAILCMTCLFVSQCRDKKNVPAPIVFEIKRGTEAPEIGTPKSETADNKNIQKEKEGTKLSAKVPPTTPKTSNDTKDATTSKTAEESEPLTVVEKIKAESAQEKHLETIKINAKSTPTPQISPSLAGAKESKKGQIFYHQARIQVEAGKAEEAKGLYLKSCQYGYYEACHKFAYYEQRDGSFDNAVRFYKIGCDAGILKSCNNLGFGMEQAGKLESAKDFYSQACIKKHSLACKNLIRILDQSKLAH